MASTEESNEIHLRNRLGKNEDSGVANSFGSMDIGRGHRLRSETDSFPIINERPVDDISIEFFYTPHTLTLLFLSISAVIYFAFVR